MVSWKSGIGVLALLLACGPATAQEDSAILRYKFRAGEKLNYQIEQKTNMKMTVAGMNIMADLTQTIDMIWDIKSVDNDGKVKMSHTFERVSFKMNSPMGKIEYDSKIGKLPEGMIGELIGPILQAMAGAEFKVTMDARGRILDVEIPEKFADALKKLPNAGAIGGDMFGPEGMKQMIMQSSLLLPEGAVTKGKSWDQKLDTKIPLGKMETANTYTYEGMTKRGNSQLAQIDTKSKLTLDPAPNAQITAKLKAQESKGTAYIDPATGRLVEATSKQTMEMEITAMGQQVVQETEQTITVKLQDKEKSK